MPDNCTGAAFCLEFGSLHVNKDGSGHFVFDEDKPEYGDDRCGGPDGPEGSVYWKVSLSADDLNEFRTLFTTGRFTKAPAPLPSREELWAVVWGRLQTDGVVVCDLITDAVIELFNRGRG